MYTAVQSLYIYKYASYNNNIGKFINKYLKIPELYIYEFLLYKILW